MQQQKIEASLIKTQVKQALIEDLGLDLPESTIKDHEQAINLSCDITASLISTKRKMHAQIITREDCIICGVDWATNAFEQCDPNIELNWQVKDGDKVTATSPLVYIEGNAHAILTAERTALNFLQMLSGTATTTNQYAQILAGSATKLLDTRKTIPLFRQAQKYAVRCGGGHNHRVGLYDAFLIKENHIHACGGINQAVEQARALHPNKPIEVEVENLEELKKAIESSVDIVMLDNFSTDLILQAVAINKGPSKLEVSGNITHERLKELATTGVDFVSSGALTKNINAIDLSLIKRN